MKKILFAATAFVFSSGSALAAFSVQELQQAESLALAGFAQENAGHLVHLTGWKTWKSGEDAKVKIYVNHDGMNMEYNYQCRKLGDGKLQCQPQ